MDRVFKNPMVEVRIKLVGCLLSIHTFSGRDRKKINIKILKRMVGCLLSIHTFSGRDRKKSTLKSLKGWLDVYSLYTLFLEETENKINTKILMRKTWKIKTIDLFSKLNILYKLLKDCY